MLIPDWKRVLTKAWSVRLMYIAGLLSAIEAVLPLFQSRIPHGRFAIATFIITAAAVIARLWAQPKMYGGSDGRKRK
jgi:hypothetical protein